MKPLTVFEAYKIAEARYYSLKNLWLDAEIDDVEYLQLARKLLRQSWLFELWLINYLSKEE